MQILSKRHSVLQEVLTKNYLVHRVKTSKRFLKAESRRADRLKRCGAADVNETNNDDAAETCRRLKRMRISDEDTDADSPVASSEECPSFPSKCVYEAMANFMPIMPDFLNIKEQPEMAPRRFAEDGTAKEVMTLAEDGIAGAMVLGRKIKVVPRSTFSPVSY